MAFEHQFFSHLYFVYSRVAKGTWKVKEKLQLGKNTRITKKSKGAWKWVFDPNSKNSWIRSHYFELFTKMEFYITLRNKNGGTVGPNDLLNAFDEQVLQDKITLPLPPSEIMNTWTTNRGYPLVRVHKIANQSLIIIEQVWLITIEHCVVLKNIISYI